MDDNDTPRVEKEDKIHAAGRLLDTYARFESIAGSQLARVRAIRKVGTTKSWHRFDYQLFGELEKSLKGTPLLPNLHMIALALPKSARYIDKIIERTKYIEDERNWIVSEFGDFSKKQGFLKRIFAPRKINFAHPIPFTVDELHSWSDELHDFMLELDKVVWNETRVSWGATMGLGNLFEVTRGPDGHYAETLAPIRREGETLM